jgi:hypothetical protein
MAAVSAERVLGVKLAAVCVLHVVTGVLGQRLRQVDGHGGERRERLSITRSKLPVYSGAAVLRGGAGERGAACGLSAAVPEHSACERQHDSDRMGVVLVVRVARIVMMLATTRGLVGSQCRPIMSRGVGGGFKFPRVHHGQHCSYGTEKWTHAHHKQRRRHSRRNKSY